jgi:hypothetical protein
VWPLAIPGDSCPRSHGRRRFCVIGCRTRSSFVTDGFAGHYEADGFTMSPARDVVLQRHLVRLVAADLARHALDHLLEGQIPPAFRERLDGRSALIGTCHATDHHGEADEITDMAVHDRRLLQEIFLSLDQTRTLSPSDGPNPRTTSWRQSSASATGPYSLRPVGRPDEMSPLMRTVRGNPPSFVSGPTPRPDRR